MANEENAKVTMLLCSDLLAVEQEKVERLDGSIAHHLESQGVSARVCHGRGNNSDRVLEFIGMGGVVATINATDFLAAKDAESIALIKLSEAAQ
ncbi:MAG: hypothetical protein ACK449_03840 [Planctomycetota bacterium]|jgi:hypothetical protein